VAHHASAALHLALGELVPLSSVGIIARSQLDPNGSAMQRELPAKDLFQIALVTRRQGLCLGAMNHHNGRILPTGMRVAEFDPSSIDHGWRMTGDRILKDPGEAGRAQRSGCRVVGSVNRAIQLANPRSVQG